MRLRLIALVLLGTAATAAGLVLAEVDSTRDAWLVSGTGFALAALTGGLAVTTMGRRRAMREVERYFTLSPEIVVLAGFDGYWKRVNPAIEEVLGYSEEEALGRPFSEFVHPGDRARTEEEARRVARGATAHRFENRMLCSDGSYKWIEWTATPVPKEGVLYGIGRDITQRRRSEHEQAALQRISTLVAQEVPQADVFAAIAEEIAALLGTEEIRMLRYESDTSAVVVGTSGRRDAFPLDSHQQLEGDSVASRVRRTGQPVRIDDYSAPSGPLAETARSIGVRAVVGVPVCVNELLWGAISTGSTDNEPLPPDTEARLLHLTELMATAIANAEARDARALLAEEQAALRRVATLVAYESSPVRIFSAVTEEAARVLACEAAGLLRFEPDGTATLVAQSDTPWDPPPLGTQFALDGENLVVEVFRTGRAARADDWTSSSGSVAAMASVLGVRSAVASPVVVEGVLWGTIIAATSQSEPLPTEMEFRIAQFTELVATAIANAESREALARLAEEQAALRRVATLVAQQPSPEEIFEVVSVEVARVFGFDADPASPDLAGVVRFEPGPALVAVGASKVGEPVKLGVRFPTDELYVSSHVLRTGRSARVGADDLDSVGGETADWFRHYGLLSQVGSPIVVEGRLWGAMTVNSGNDFPADTEERLERFTELIATAIANAQARDALARLADEQAALRRVATLVARGIGPDGVFRAVASEVGRLFGADVAAIVRFEDDGTATVLGDVGGPHVSGKRVTLDDGYVVHRVRETGESSRFDTDDPSTADMPSLVRTLGIRSSVASPIVVEGALWGAITAGSVEGPLPSSAERRLTEFTELVATAVANTHAREEVTALVDEQAALRRVATLVAVEASQEEIFTAVAEGVAGVLGEELRLVRFEGDLAVVVATSEGAHIDVLPVGTRLPVGGHNALSRVFQTGKPTRIDDYSKASGPIAEAVRATGLRSIVATPVVVEGRIWGAMIVGTFGDKPVPPGTEDRLGQFVELMATDIANTEARAELVASRARIVAAGDEARRRIERNLHDGTQQRLVSLGLAVRAAQASLPSDQDDLRAQLSGVATGLVAAVEDLQEISRGIHPAILSKGGLGPALQALAHRSAIPVELDITTDVRLEEPIEVAAYFVASEALANAVKHSEASRIDISLEQRDGRLLLAVRDDGVGGAAAASGSGLVGLIDRVEALGGLIRVSSRPGEGTQIAVALPVEPNLSATTG